MVFEELYAFNSLPEIGGKRIPWVGSSSWTRLCAASRPPGDRSGGNSQWSHLQFRNVLQFGTSGVLHANNIPSSMSGGRPPTKTLREKRSPVSDPWLCGEERDGDDRGCAELGIPWGPPDSPTMPVCGPIPMPRPPWLPSSSKAPPVSSRPVKNGLLPEAQKKNTFWEK